MPMDDKTAKEQVATLTATVDQLQAQLDTIMQIVTVSLVAASLVVGLVIYERYVA